MPWLIIAGLLPIIWQDFKDRAIHVGFLLAFIILSMISAWQTALPFHEWIMNLGFILFILGILSFYFSMKNRRWVNIIDSYLGLGDVVFFIGLCFLFPLVNMLAFFVFSLVFSLIVYGIITLFKKGEHNNIPLAGLMGICLIGTIIIVEINNYDLNNSQFILTKLNTLYGLD